MARATKAAARPTAKKQPASARPAAKKSTKKAATKKVTAKKGPSKTVTTKKATAKKTTKKATTKKAVAKRSPAKKSATTKAVTKKAPAKKAATKKSVAKNAAAKKTTAAKPAKKAAAKKKLTSPYDKKFLELQRESLTAERLRLSHDVAALDAEANELAMMREPGDVQFDEESGEGDTLAVERERDLALSAQFRSQIEDIDHALAKIDAGTYGLCEVSGLAIPKERLKAIPWARERVEYKVGGFRR